MRLAVYCDYSYRIQDGRLFAELPVGLFLAALAPHCERVTLAGRFDPSPGRFPYELTGVEFVGLPYYASGADPWALVKSLPRGIARFWQMLDSVDVVWLLGPTPLSVLFALLTVMRGRRLALGVRQDLPRLFRRRRPERRILALGADLLECSFRLLSRRCAVVVVGPDLARRYRRARSLHDLMISLVRREDIMAPGDDERRYDGDELRILSVGRLDPEKNPLLLADAFAAAVARDPRWRLDVCGEGTLADALADRLRALGVSDRAILHGNVPIDGGLIELYARSHVLLHVSWTEGMPQVILEAFALRLPVVATAVGGVPALVDGSGLLIEPGDAAAAVRAVERIAADGDLRSALVEHGSALAEAHSLESEAARLVAFLARA
ncbi:MAG: glycosyltransferase [Solirubrobacteraceae bacterium]